MLFGNRTCEKVSKCWAFVSRDEKFSLAENFNQIFVQLLQGGKVSDRNRENVWKEFGSKEERRKERNSFVLINVNFWIMIFSASGVNLIGPFQIIEKSIFLCKRRFSFTIIERSILHCFDIYTFLSCRLWRKVSSIFFVISD